jgi:predicted nucleic acid-binding protein
MIIVVDTNILIAALITPNGKLAQILGYPNLPAKRISCHYLFGELFTHQPKIIKSAKRTADSVTDDLLFYLKNINLYDESFIANEHWQEADRLTSGVDSKDISFVALALQTGAWLWTGDKKLASHLKTMGFDRVMNTAELYERLEIS